MTQVVVVQGLQFGSEGKGQICGLIANQWKPDTVVCANHPNAGHTYFDGFDKKFIHRTLPVAAVEKSVNHVLLGPGAVIDVPVLIDEIDRMAEAGRVSGKTFIVHPNAAVVFPHHREAEAKFVKIGSTMKGSAEAVIQKMRRDPNNKNTFSGVFNMLVDELTSAGTPYNIICSATMYDEVINTSQRLLVEGAQGFSLGIHERFYPYGTSRDVSVHQVLADCRIPFGLPVYVHGVIRTYPIRVANRIAEDGTFLGTSGPCYPDQSEIKWSDLGREPELTTVTKLPRRIFTFSYKQLQEAIRVNGVHSLSLTFCDYFNPSSPHFEEMIHMIRLTAGQTPISYSFGPNFRDTKGWAEQPLDFAKHFDNHFLP